MRRRAVLTTFAVILSASVLPGCADQQSDQPGIEKAEALLGGDSGVRLDSFEIRYQQRRVRCSDPDALRYLEACLREGERNPKLGLGTTYLLRLRFAGGGSLEATTYWSGRGFCLYMPYQMTDRGEDPRANVVLKPPVPEPVAEMMTFLDRPYQEVKGVVLAIEPGGIRRDFDPSLVAK